MAENTVELNGRGNGYYNGVSAGGTILSRMKYNYQKCLKKIPKLKISSASCRNINICLLAIKYMRRSYEEKMYIINAETSQ
jgi:hypothetical protein